MRIRNLWLTAAALGLALATTVQAQAPRRLVPGGCYQALIERYELLVPEGLDEIEVAELVYLKEEEKLARDVYATLSLQHDVPVFSNIARAEQQHMRHVDLLLARYGFDDPVIDDAIGAFSNPGLATMYGDVLSECGGRRSARIGDLHDGESDIGGDRNGTGAGRGSSGGHGTGERDGAGPHGASEGDCDGSGPHGWGTGGDPLMCPVTSIDSTRPAPRRAPSFRHPRAPAHPTLSSRVPQGRRFSAWTVSSRHCSPPRLGSRPDGLLHRRARRATDQPPAAGAERRVAGTRVPCLVETTCRSGNMRSSPQAGARAPHRDHL